MKKVEKNTQIWLTGTEAYRRAYGQFVTREKKSNFEKLLVNVDEATVFLNKTTEKKYIEKIISLGYKILSKDEYDMFSISLKIERAS